MHALPCYRSFEQGHQVWSMHEPLMTTHECRNLSRRPNEPTPCQSADLMTKPYGQTARAYADPLEQQC